jgi:hypothetical protein
MKALICSCLVFGSLLPLATSASANQTGRTCPPTSSGYIVWDVTTEPYQADNAVDVNGNGTVCAHPVDAQTFVNNGQTYQIYNFIDDLP